MPITAQYEGVRVASKKRIQEKSMPQSNSQVEMSEQVPDDIDAALDAALEKSGVDVEHKAIQDAAVAEERRSAEMLAKVRDIQEGGDGVLVQPAKDESLVSAMAGGREHLMKRMREHAAETAAKKNEYKPPAMTERQLAVLQEEQAAGQRARERHEAELASRPPSPAKEKWDGTNTPVFRPGSNVPDPVLPAGHSAAGTRQYGPNA